MTSDETAGKDTPMRPLTRLALAGLAGLCAVSAGCSGPAATAGPEETLAEFARALRERRFDDAWSLMDDGYRRRVTREQFRARLAQSAAETAETAEALGHAIGPAEQEAVVRYGTGESVRLVRDDAGWRVATPVVDFYDQSTPRAALRAFVRAMERRRYDVVLRLVPAADREGMTVERMRAAWEGDSREEIERLVATLRGALDRPIEEVGDRATMPYGERFTAELVREDGAWKIEDPD